MLSALMIFAAEQAEHAEPSKLPFYLAGSLLALWAFGVSAYGIRRHGDWPPSEGAARAVMAVSTVLVAAAMVSAVISG